MVTRRPGAPHWGAGGVSGPPPRGATKHLQSQAHCRNKQRKHTVVIKPGISAKVESAPAATEVPTKERATPTKTPTKQVDLKEVLSGLNENQGVADDFVAAFLQAGIPPLKLQHPSIQGLLQKYTKVAGP